MKRTTSIVLCALVPTCVLSSREAGAEISFANIFNNNMVLQQGKPLRIWGRADAGAEVGVSFGDRRASARADKNGRCSVELKPLKPSFDPRKLTASSGDKTVTLKNVLVGEV